MAAAPGILLKAFSLFPAICCAPPGPGHVDNLFVEGKGAKSAGERRKCHYLLSQLSAARPFSWGSWRRGAPPCPHSGGGGSLALRGWDLLNQVCPDLADPVAWTGGGGGRVLQGRQAEGGLVTASFSPRIGVDWGAPVLILAWVGAVATSLGPEDAESRDGSRSLPGGDGEPVAGRGDWGAPHPCSHQLCDSSSPCTPRHPKTGSGLSLSGGTGGDSEPAMWKQQQ